MAPITKLQGRVPILFSKKAARPIDYIEAAEIVRRRSRIWIALALILGTGIGSLVMYEHDRGQDVVAAINGIILDKQQLFDQMQPQYGPKAVNVIAQEELLLQFAKQRHAYPTDAQVEFQYKEISKLPQFQQRLQLESEDYIKHAIRLKLSQANLMGRGVKVTDQEVLNYYHFQTDPNNTNALYYQPEKVTLRILVTNTEEQCNRAWHDLTAGVPFTALVRKYSVDKSKQNYGLLAPIRRGWRTLTPEFENAIFSMRIGDTIGPRYFDFPDPRTGQIRRTWWIIQCRDKNTSIYTPFNQVKEECRIAAKEIKGYPINGPKLQHDFTMYKKNAKYQAFWPGYENAFQAE